MSHELAERGHHSSGSGGGHGGGNDDDDDDDGNKQRAFLQALLSQPTHTLDSARALIARIEAAAGRPAAARGAVTDGEVEAYFAAARAALSPFDLEIRSARHQRARTRTWALVNTSGDALAQLATRRTADELAFVKRVLDAIFVTHNRGAAEVMAVTSLQALPLAKAPLATQAPSQPSPSSTPAPAPASAAAAAASLTMTHAEKVLEGLVAEGWFEKSARGFYSLSPRALMELRGWLVATYNEPADEGEDDDDEDEEGGARNRIKFCAACRDIVTVGQRCPELTCAVRLHDHCVENVFRAQQRREQCPTCRTAWRDAPAVGEDAAPGNSGRRRGRGEAASAASRGANEVDGQRNEDDVSHQDNDDLYGVSDDAEEA